MCCACVLLHHEGSEPIKFGKAAAAVKIWGGDWPNSRSWWGNTVAKALFTRDEIAVLSEIEVPNENIPEQFGKPAGGKSWGMGSIYPEGLREINYETGDSDKKVQ